MSIDYDSVTDKNLTLEEFAEKLEDLLRKNRIGIVKRRNIVRQKTQEFKDLSFYCTISISKISDSN
ncbi:MAG: hypothetical protein JW891_18665 [Candidatus Lokiarchaeota archaeon]|nr:hypothetical protein [Candidatus Lokiarchaeota archaeon]